MSCKYLKGGRCSNLSVKGGLVMMVPSVAFVLFNTSALTPVLFSAMTYSKVHPTLKYLVLRKFVPNRHTPCIFKWILFIFGRRVSLCFFDGWSVRVLKNLGNSLFIIKACKDFTTSWYPARLFEGRHALEAKRAKWLKWQRHQFRYGLLMKCCPRRKLIRR